MLGGQSISVVNGKCINDEATLAGSDLDMASAVRNAISMLGLDLASAISLASSNPAAFLGLDDALGRIAPGYRASFVLLDDSLQVTRTWIDGVPSELD
jgi:N-acetylglucosamine-6-phosphate deacetylase